MTYRSSISRLKLVDSCRRRRTSDLEQVICYQHSGSFVLYFLVDIFWKSRTASTSLPASTKRFSSECVDGGKWNRSAEKLHIFLEGFLCSLSGGIDGPS
jgi:hypothetical protein